MTTRYGCDVPGHPQNHAHDCDGFTKPLTPPIVARVDFDDRWHAFDPLGDEPRAWCGLIVHTIFPNTTWSDVANRCDACETMMEPAPPDSDFVEVDRP